jgi:hypothetical protein
MSKKKVTAKKKTRSTKRKASKKATKKDDKVIKPEDLTPASYNPRQMDTESRKGLEASMKQFDDISGITWNKTTGNIVTGHHRWETLVEEYGFETLSFDHLKGDRYAIMSGEIDTNYSLRQVEWDEAKEKAANIAANSHAIEGQFTVDLEGLLDDLQTELDGDLFADLRFDKLDLNFDIGDETSDYGESSEDNWDSNIEKIKNIDETDQTMYANITIQCQKEQKVKLVELIKKALGEADVSIR